MPLQMAREREFTNALNVKTQESFSAIAFSQANHFEYIKAKKPFDVCYSLEMNEFRGNRNLQLNVKDIKTPDTK